MQSTPSVQYTYKLMRISIFIILLTAIIFCLYKACSHHQQSPTTTYGKPKVIPLQTPRSYKSSGGTVHTETKVVEAASDVWLKDYYESLLSDVRDSLKIAQKQIERIAAIGIEYKGSIAVPIDSSYENDIKNDTGCPEPVRRFKFNDKFLRVAGLSTADSVYMAYYVTDSLTVTTYWKRKNFLSKKELYINAFSANPNATVKGLQELKIQKATPKKWAIGIQGGYYLTNQGFQPAIGIGITRSIIRF